MALIHEHLYKQEFFSAIRMATYTADLVLHIRSLYGKAGHDLHFVLAIPETLLVDLDQAICCGLILTELLTNAIRHAFPQGHERKPEVKVTLREEREDLLVLEVADNGVGFPEVALTDKGQSLGLRIVHALARQLDGTVTFLNAEGCVARLTFARTSRGNTVKNTL
jgi:two-component sensor histidine kinase